MGEQKRRLAARGRPDDPRSAASLIARGFRALQADDRRAAEGAFDALPDALAPDAELLNAGAILGLQLGRNARAAELLARAVALDARNPAYRCHLAIAHRRLGRLDLAAEELAAALRLDPALVEAHSNLGLVLLDLGQHEAAACSFERALALRPDFPDALNGLGSAELARGHHERACTLLERAAAIDPAFHEARYNLARARTQWAARLEASSGTGAAPPPAVENAELGLESILAALELAGDVPAYWEQFEASVSRFDLRHPVDPRVRATLLAALGHPAVDPAQLARPIVSLVTTHPAAVAIAARLPAAGGVDPSAWTELRAEVAAVLGDALLQRLLEDVVVPSAFVQRLLALARHALLRETLADPAAAPSLPLAAIAAVAQQGFNTEYVNAESAGETAAVAKLEEGIARARVAEDAVPPHWYAIFACYRPLHALAAAERVAADLAGTGARLLAVRQIEEPLEERRIRPAIVALTGVADETSAAVRRQYEDNPYPRWLRARTDIAPTTVGAHLRRLFPDADLGGIGDEPAHILVAGCGTGRHPIETALRFRGSRVLAVDLSRTSLAYAIRKTRELGIGNVDYRQADLLALDSLAERFDVVECSGVLHHLKDPAAGWRTLCSLLRPGGAMRIGLYSELARRHVVRGREVVARGGHAATVDGIRACRAEILARQDDPLLARIARGVDFYSLSGCRDLLFHVQEQRFTLPRIAGLLAELGLTFLGFDLADPAVHERYRARFPDDRAPGDLGHWHEFEAEYPDTFAQMYSFWVRKPA